MDYLSEANLNVSFMKTISTIVTVLSALWSLSACAQDELAELKKDPSVNQIVSVVALEGSNAYVQLYVRGERGWTLEGEGDAYIGKNGLGKEKEGDGKTPVGLFGVREAFGLLPDPGTGLEYKQVTTSLFACDEDCEYYNRIIDTAVVHHPCKGEDMYHCTPSYNYGISIDYNTENKYPLGSAIFLHCYGKKQYTAGCVAVEEKFMKQILMAAQPGMKVLIRPMQTALTAAQ